MQPAAPAPPPPLSAGAGAVVTGAGRGIGRAVATRLAAEGLRVVVADLDPDAARSVAAEIDGHAAPGDSATTTGVRDLIATARAALGRIDVFVANAGIGAGRGLETPEGVWDRVLEVNLMGNVRAARAVVPGWVADGLGGRFVVTASAAGLLTMVGNAPYAVSKHAAVAFAEWLSISYRHAGIGVHAVCPQGVRTAMLDGSGPARPLLADGALEPEDVAAALWEAMSQNRFLVLPHPQVRDYYLARAGDTDRWLAGMNRLHLSLGMDHEEPWADAPPTGQEDEGGLPAQ